jgi:BirA family biotin operon repressor/biotin-[acetyl-CoA-carboxylase] ligase
MLNSKNLKRIIILLLNYPPQAHTGSRQTIDMNSGRDIIFLDRVDSTNTYLKNRPELWDRSFVTVVAAEQTGGRGRHTRKWHSKPGSDLTFSTLCIPPQSVHDPSPITVIAGLAAYRCLRRYCGKGLNLKWPNDILYRNKKLGGILCEMVVGKRGAAVIVGIGINVNSTDFPEEISSTATSLKTITGKEHDVRAVCGGILDELSSLMRDFRVPLDRGLLEEWTAASASIGRRVTFHLDGKEETGTIAGINPDGSLVLIGSTGAIIDSYKDEILYKLE